MLKRMNLTPFPWLMLGVVLLALGCGNVEEKDDAGPLDSDTGLIDGGEGDLDGGTVDAGDTSAPIEGTCVELVLDLHTGTGQALVTLKTMSVTNEDLVEYDFAMVNQMPEPPGIFLGPSVTALNLGNETSFEDVLEAPPVGYAPDGDTAVIGTGWRTGGNGTDGHEVNGNTYVLKTADGRYGKIRITSAKQGASTIDAYFQADGSSSLECAFAR